MKLSILVIVFLLFVISSCKNDRTYRYFEVISHEGASGELTTSERIRKTIKAASDSVAYLEAYQEFCIALKINADMQHIVGKVYSTPVKFKLYDDKGLDIVTTISFAGKAKGEREIWKKVFSLANVLDESIDHPEAKQGNR